MARSRASINHWDNLIVEAVESLAPHVAPVLFNTILEYFKVPLMERMNFFID